MIRLNATADVIRLQSSVAQNLAYTIAAIDVITSTTIDASVSGTNADAVKNNIITAPEAGHRKDVTAITVSNAVADSNPRVRLFKYIATVETTLVDVVLPYGKTLKYDGSEYKIVPTVDPTAAGPVSRTEITAALAAAAAAQADADTANALLAEFPETDPEVEGQIWHDDDTYVTSAGEV